MSTRFLIIVILFLVIPFLGSVTTMAGSPTIPSSTPESQEVAVKTADRSAGLFALKHVASDTETVINIHQTPRPLPEVSFTDGEGRAMTLSAFEGKVILLNIWATWCVPCREEMPTLDNLEAKLGGADFQVVALSIDQGGVAPVRDFYAEIGLRNLKIYIDDQMRAPPLLGVVGIPGTLLIDREGREIGRKLGPAEWDSEEVVAEIRRYLE